MDVHLVDGTYELVRHYYGQGRAPAGSDRAGSDRAGSDRATSDRAGSDRATSDRAAARGVVSSVLALMEDGATHVGVATDHVIESFRNEMWPGYKTGELVPADLRGQFDLVEVALESLGVVVWPMVEVEADDALASAAAAAAADPRVAQVVICTPDKDLGQCVSGTRVVQLDRRRRLVLDEAAVTEKFGVPPASIPDWLALVGDAADGFPGVRGWGQRSAAAVLSRYAHLEAIPDRASEWDPDLRSAVRGAERLADALAAARPEADLFKVLATLRIDPSLVRDVDDLAWTGPDRSFASMAEMLGAPGAARRADALAARRQCPAEKTADSSAGTGESSWS